MRHDHIPEVLRRRAVLGHVVLLVHAQVADELRNVLVGMPTIEDIRAGDGRILHVAIVEIARDGEILGLVGAQRMQTGKGVIRTAVFAGDVHVPHAIELLGAHLRESAVRPVADLRCDIQRLRVAGERVRVEQSCDDLVQRVVRRPDPLVAAVGRELLETHELRFGVGRQEARVTATVGGCDHGAMTALARRVFHARAVGLVEVIREHVPPAGGPGGRRHQRLHVGCGERAIEDLERVELRIEIRDVALRELTPAEPVARRFAQIGRRERHVGVGGDRLPVYVQRGRGARTRDGDMRPAIDRERRGGIEALLTVRAAGGDGEARYGCVVARAHGEIHACVRGFGELRVRTAEVEDRGAVGERRQVRRGACVGETFTIVLRRVDP